MIKSILITGGGSSIRAALAINLAQPGCNIVIAGRYQASLDATAKAPPNIAALIRDKCHGAMDLVVQACTTLVGRPPVVHRIRLRYVSARRCCGLLCRAVGLRNAAPRTTNRMG